MASQVGLGPRAVVWRTLTYAIKRSGDNTHHCRSPTPTLIGCDSITSTRTQSSEQGYSYLTACKNHSSTSYSHNTPELFMRNPTVCLAKVNKTCVYVFGMLPGCLENLLESGNVFCSATPTTKTALGFIQVWFNYFRGILSYTLPGRLSKQMPRWLVHSLLSPFLCMGMINLPIFRCAYKTPWHLTHTSQLNHPTF